MSGERAEAVTDRASNRWGARASAFLVAVGTLALLILTEPMLAMGWDEGYTLGREARLRSWFLAVRDPSSFARNWVPPSPNDELVADTMLPPRPEQIDSRAKLFSREVLAWFWPFAREEPHGHPPFYAMVGLIGDVLTPSWEALPRARLGPMIVFSLAAGAIFLALNRRWGVWPAAMSAGAWVFQPQMFALAHYAGYDAILSSLWIGAILAFSRAVGDASTSGNRRWPWVVLFGVFCGWAADTKLTGWFLPLPFVAWAIVARSRRGLLTLIVGGGDALLTLYAFNPVWWADPIVGIRRFLVSNLSRGDTVPIPVLFLGQVVLTPRASLPWYNTLVWTAIATPVGFLAFALAGTVRSIRLRMSSDPLPILALGHWAFLLILRALPHTPGHDGVRQFLPAFGCLAMVAGVGAAWAVTRLGRWGKMLISLALIEGAVSVAVMMPVPLSYFSPIVGGLPGAARIGMEPTYFWDALTDEALARLDRRVPQGQSVRFATYPTSWLYLKRAGKIRVPIWPISKTEPAVYIVQNRPGAFRLVDRLLVKSAGSDPRNILSEKFGVPLVWAFPYEEFRRIEASVRMQDSPGGER